MKRIAWTSCAIAALVLGGLGRGNPMRAGDEPSGHDKVFDVCAKACAECTNSCASCYHHCVALVTEGKRDHSKSLVLCNDCAAKLTSRHSPLSAMVCDACAKACDECAAACEKFSDDKHMTDCAKTCRDCATACREMIKHLSS